MRFSVPTLRTQRLTLRALEREDADDLQRAANNPKVARNLFDGFPHPYTLEHGILWCEDESHRVEEFGYVWGLEFEGNIIGVMGGCPEKGWLRCGMEMGWWLGEPHWGKGLAAESLAAIVPWIWQNLPDVTRLQANIFSWNAPSMRVAEKCGFVREGMHEQSAIKGGRVIDRVMWALVRAKTENSALIAP